LSGDKWTIAVNIAINDYESLVKAIHLLLGQVRRNIQVHKEPNASTFDIHWEGTNRLEILNQELENDVNSFRQLLFKGQMNKKPMIPKIRAKRGLINVLGYGLKYLFGTVDAKDVQRLTAVCNELHTFESRMVHVTDQQLTYLWTLDESVGQNTKDVMNLVRCCAIQFRIFHCN
jgi:hypothetical protein